ncbi:MAG: mreD [Micavibrio sp.]|nr:mreD [Micavibrio sp.]
MAINLSFKGLENALRLMVPVIFLAFLFMLSVVALPIPQIGHIKPAYILMTIYYWSIFRPTLVPPWICFFVGLLLDLLSNLTPGVNAVIFTLVQWVVRDQRQFLMGQPYIVLWFVFAFVTACAHMMQWGMYGLAAGLQWAPLLPVGISMAATFLLFPVISLVLILIHRVLPETQRAYS